jgi:phosphoribosyl 1,2-cyclic phosphodiesterase
LIIAPLCSSSAANATFIGTRDCGILIDIGCSYKALRGYLSLCGIKPEAIKAVLITHEHGDHVSGLRVFAKNNPEIPVGGSTDSGFKDFTIKSFSVFHDVECVGYVIRRGDCQVAYLTDLGEITPEIEEATLGSNALFIESNYDPEMLHRNTKYPQCIKDRIRATHLSNGAAAEFICKAVRGGTTRVVLGHLSQENNTPKTAFDAVTSRLAASGLRLNHDYTLDVAGVKTCGEYIAL